MSDQATIKKPGIMLAVAIMAITALSMSSGTIQPAMAKIYAAYPDVPMTTMMYIVSLPSVFAIIGTFVSGMLAGRKVSYKAICFTMGIVWLVTGVAPYFMYGFEFLMVTRCIYMFAMGALMPLYNPLIAAFYDKDRQATLLSISTFVGFGAAMIFQVVAGALADVEWNMVFLTHLIGVIPLILFFWLKEPPKQEKVKNERGALPARAIVLAVMFAVLGLCMMPLLMNYSVITAQYSDSSAVAAFVQLFYSIGCMIGGLLFSLFFKFFKRFTIGIAAILAAVGMAIVVFGGNIPIMCVGMFIAGFGYCMVMPACLYIIGVVVNPRLVPFATSIFMMLMNVTSFIATPFITLISGFAGGDAVYAPVIVSVVIAAVIGVITLIVNPFPKGQTVESAQGSE